MDENFRFYLETGSIEIILFDDSTYGSDVTSVKS